MGSRIRKCTWRTAAGIVANLVNGSLLYEGNGGNDGRKDYLHYYCAGHEGTIAADVAQDLEAIGWVHLPDYYKTSASRFTHDGPTYPFSVATVKTLKESWYKTADTPSYPDLKRARLADEYLAAPSSPSYSPTSPIASP